MDKKKRIVIIGATSAIAEHCARLWLQSEITDMTLVGRDAGRLERVAADLKVRSPGSKVRFAQAGFHNPADIEATVSSIVPDGDIDIVLIAHGSLPLQAECQDDLNACRSALEINAVSPVLYAEAFAKRMAEARHGAIVLIGSVAGDRGRKSNYVYGAAKGLVTRYAEGLQHRFAGTDINVVLVKPGPTDTPMTAHMKAQGARLAPVDRVAEKIVAAVKAEKSVVYVPGRWRSIMLIIQHLPAFVFNKMDI